jgi:hypothetical protein
VLVAVVREHLAEIPPSDPEDLIFNGPKGAASRRNSFHRSARWAERVAEAGLPAAAVVNTTACATSDGRETATRDPDITETVETDPTTS